MNLPNIILLGQAKESSDLGGSLGSKALGVDHIGEAGDITIALLDN